jgi:Kef-type K+ transport system membrane component KefB
MPGLDPQLWPLLPHLAWPLVLLLAWLAGEAGYRFLSLPRISVYALTGVIAGTDQLGLLPEGQGMGLLANVGFGLLLFELGYRVNLRWFVHNPWLGVTALADAVLCFVAIGLVSRALGADVATAALLGALGMASSPAALVRVINEERATGQIAERLLHFALVSCILAVLAFKAVLAVYLFQSSGSMARALYAGAWTALASAVLGLAVGLVLTTMLRVPRHEPDTTLPYALGVVGLVAATHLLQLSPIVAALALGLTVRHRRVVIGRNARGFGTLGELLTLALFVYLGSRLDLRLVASGLELGLALVATRLAITPAVLAALAPLSGTTWKKGALTGLGLMPLSAFVLLLLEQSRHLEVDLIDRVAPLAVAALVLELLGPILTRTALRWGGEAQR